MTRHYYLDSALLPQGWMRGVKVSVADDGHISAVDAPTGSHGHDANTLPGSSSRHAERAQPRVSTRYGGQHGISSVGPRQLLDLAPSHVPPRESHRARRLADPGDAIVHRNAQVGLHLRRGIPLSTPPAQRRSLSRRRSLGRHRRCGRRGRHRPDVPADPLPDQRLRRATAETRADAVLHWKPSNSCVR